MKDTVVLDAGVLIAYLDEVDAHHDSVVAALQRVEESTKFISSSVSLSEALVAPAREGLDAVERALFSIKALADVEIRSMDEATAISVAAIRAKHPSLKTPDAVVIATARVGGSQFALTTDLRLARVDEAVTVREFLAR